MHCKNCKNKTLKMTTAGGPRVSKGVHRKIESALHIRAKMQGNMRKQKRKRKNHCKCLLLFYLFICFYSAWFSDIYSKWFDLWFNQWIANESSKVFSWIDKTAKKHAPYRFEAILNQLFVNWIAIKSNNKNRRHVNIIEIGANELWKTNERTK